MRVATFNVNGAASSATEIARLANSCDIVCLQEIKTARPIVVPGFETFWTPAPYASNHHGTAILARSEFNPKRLDVQLENSLDLDDNGRRGHFSEGRITAISLSINCRTLNVLSVYSPNSGVDRREPLKRLGYRTNQWDRDLGRLVQTLMADTVPLLLCGDLNVAVDDNDVHNSKTLSRKAGFTPQERASFRRHLLAHLTDSMPADMNTRFTFFGPFQKAVNRGWRLDYQLYSSALIVRDIRILYDYDSSDHVPVYAEYDFN